MMVMTLRRIVVSSRTPKGEGSFCLKMNIKKKKFIFYRRAKERKDSSLRSE